MTTERREPDPATRFAQTTMVLRIIVIALTLGLLSFAGIALAFHGPAKGQAQAPAIPTVLVIGMSLAGIAAAWFIPPSIDARSRREATRKWPEAGSPSPLEVEAAQGALALAYQGRTIVRCALLEGPAMFCLIAYMIGSDMSSLAVGLALAAAVAANFPGSGRIEAWADAQLDRAIQERQFA